MTASAFTLPAGCDNLIAFIRGLEGVQPDASKTVVDTFDSVEMGTVPIEQFLAFRAKYYRPHGDQRDHVQRVMSGKLKRVVDRFLPPHGTLVFTELNGEFELADGNGRAYLWSEQPQQHMEIPSHVSMLVYHCKDEAEHRGVYDCVDSAVSKKGSCDVLASAIRRAGLTERLTASRFKTGRFKGVLSFSAGRQTSSGMTLDELTREVVKLKAGLLAANKLDIINSQPQCPTFLLATYVTLLNNPENVHAVAYAHALHATYNTLDRVVDPGIQAQFDAIARDLLKVSSRGPGCLKGRVSGEKAHLAKPLLDYYATFEKQAAAMLMPSARRSRKAA